MNGYLAACAAWCMLAAASSNALARPTTYADGIHSEAVRVLSAMCVNQHHHTVGLRLIFVRSPSSPARARLQEWIYAQQTRFWVDPVLVTGGVVGNHVNLVWRDHGDLYTLIGDIGADGAIRGLHSLYMSPEPSSVRVVLRPVRPGERTPTCGRDHVDVFDVDALTAAQSGAPVLPD